MLMKELHLTLGCFRYFPNSRRIASTELPTLDMASASSSLLTPRALVQYRTSRSSLMLISRVLIRRVLIRGISILLWLARRERAATV